MSDEDPIHLATIDWQRGKWAGFKGKYSREHTWHLSGGAKLKASGSPFMLPEGYRDNAKFDAERLFVAGVSSAHMLTWLHIALGMEIDVLGYRDEARGLLMELSGGGALDKRDYLAPQDYRTYSERSRATPAAEARLHELAHEQCFIANSIKTKVTVRRAESA